MSKKDPPAPESHFPFDAGALLHAACRRNEEETGEKRAALAVRAGIDPVTLYRACSRPDATPKTLRPILAALGMHVELVKDRPVRQPNTILLTGTLVETCAKLDSTRGLIAHPDMIDRRVPGTRGMIRGVVPGHGGDVYYVLHPGAEGDAVYNYIEFDLVKKV